MYTILHLVPVDDKNQMFWSLFPTVRRGADQPTEPPPDRPDQLRSIPDYLDPFPIIPDHSRSFRSMLRPGMLRRRTKKVFDMSKTFFVPLGINRRVRSTRNQGTILPIDLDRHPDQQNGSCKCFEGCIFLDRGVDRRPDRVCVRGALEKTHS